ncbi:enhancer of mRNA-decapping protein 3-like [Mercenaria mercenaria]|uniref:enhancer of mRNA-decapping protein 3-like n=1 Tax=Mercenaria mercenaria TaxID=6596 RepID=UPI00234FB597|nr:enhancer of mRNA-decapping protein 3-like [Mercenaria mercenaria]
MSYVGCLVSLNCGESLGTYQGQVRKVDNSAQSLSISHPFRNGVKCEVPEVTISACDIKELRIIKTSQEADKVLPKYSTPSKLSKETAEELDSVASPGRIAESKLEPNGNASTGNSNKSCVNSNARDRYTNDRRSTPTKDRLGMDFNNTNGSPHGYMAARDRDNSANGNGHRSYSVSSRYFYDWWFYIPFGLFFLLRLGCEGSKGCRNNNRNTPTKDEQFSGRRNSESEGRASHKSSVPRKIEFRKKPNSRQDCFSAPVDSLLDEFDFEKNLALFDKKAVFEEIESNNPDVIRISDKKPTKYRHDENVLQSKPVTFQQIRVPKDYGNSYVTDSGLVVPSIDYDLRNKLFDIAEACGFSMERRLEMIGRSSSEMVLQLLGGSSRLNPQNGHQLPTVLVLCGPHIQGAQGLNCARHLVNHGVRTVVFLPNFLRMVQCVEQELKMYEMCDGKRYSLDKDIPTCSIDMIVNCMDSHENSFLKDQAWYQTHVRWVSHSRAPVFTIDPPIESVDILPKWCLYPVLPLARTDVTPQVYLCDLGLPKEVFKNAGITYKSPFSHKFIIPLHPQS